MSDHEPPNEKPGSSNGSQASQTSSQLNAQRIVKLLPESARQDNTNNQGQDDWMIRAEFYNEDIVAEDAGMAHQSDDEDEINDPDDENWEDDYEADDYDFHVGDVDDFNEDDMIDMGFIIAPNIADDSDTNEELDEDLETVDYDITLPVSHRYLGEDLQESGGTQIFAEDSLVKLPLFNFKHIVLLPGQTLPITTAALSARIHRSLKVYITKGISIIGLMSDPRTNSVGTTAEIRNYSEREDQVQLILEGRQRFKLISQPFESVAEGTVKILPEVTLGRPYLVQPSCRRFLVHQISVPQKLIASKHPIWLLRQYESCNIMKKILNQIKDWCKIDLTAKNPNDFSYWVAVNLPISNHERMKVLKFDCTEQRLLWLLEILVKNTSFACANCRNVICSKEDVFPMSSTGPQNSFVNSHGYVHDTLTVRTANGLIQEQDWSEEFSWFPGYLWRIACCHYCNRHIGWCYKSKLPQIKPRRFFGLSRANVRLAEPDRTNVSRSPRNESNPDESRNQ
uniref:Protein cereblon n=1 Tax=Aceria tosichella TaxID=561515 RepID=A0A6G1S8B5_9ACAR